MNEEGLAPRELEDEEEELTPQELAKIRAIGDCISGFVSRYHDPLLKNITLSEGQLRHLLKIVSNNSQLLFSCGVFGLLIVLGDESARIRQLSELPADQQELILSSVTNGQFREAMTAEVQATWQDPIPEPVISFCLDSGLTLAWLLHQTELVLQSAPVRLDDAMLVLRRLHGTWDLHQEVVITDRVQRRVARLKQLMDDLVVCSLVHPTLVQAAVADLKRECKDIKLGDLLSPRVEWQDAQAPEQQVSRNGEHLSRKMKRVIMAGFLHHKFGVSPSEIGKLSTVGSVYERGHDDLEEFSAIFGSVPLMQDPPATDIFDRKLIIEGLRNLPDDATFCTIFNRDNPDLP